ncbi:hypothetical protein U2F10_06315 [Leptothoe sp. EHU-05/26/07-4]
MDEFDMIRAVMEKRNRAAHGLVVSLADRELEELLTTTNSLIKKWQEETSFS